MLSFLSSLKIVDSSKLTWQINTICHFQWHSVTFDAPATKMRCSHYNLTCATKKKTHTFHYTGCLIGILVMVEYNHHKIGSYNSIIPCIPQTTKVFSLLSWSWSVTWLPGSFIGTSICSICLISKTDCIARLPNSIVQEGETCKAMARAFCFLGSD